METVDQPGSGSEHHEHQEGIPSSSVREQHERQTRNCSARIMSIKRDTLVMSIGKEALDQAGKGDE